MTEALRKLAEVWPWLQNRIRHAEETAYYEEDKEVVLTVDELLTEIRRRGWRYSLWMNTPGSADARNGIHHFHYWKITNGINSYVGGLDADLLFDACALALVEIIKKEKKGG